MQQQPRLQGTGSYTTRRMGSMQTPTRAVAPRRPLPSWRTCSTGFPVTGRRFAALVPASQPKSSSIVTQAGASVASPNKSAAGSGSSVKTGTVPPGVRPGTTYAPTGPGHTMPSDAFPLTLRDGSVVSDGLGSILAALPSSTTMQSDPCTIDHGGLVLGFRNLDGPTSLVDIALGQLKAARMLACARCKLWWMTPEWRSSTLQLPPETQFLLAELPAAPSQHGTEQATGGYVLLLPLIEDNFRATLRAGSDKEGRLVIRIESGDKNVKRDAWGGVLYIAAGSDPYALIDRGVTTAARLSGGAQPLAQKRLPPSLDVFGWCTWDAFYSTVSARGIAEGLRSLHKGGIRPRTLIIDDGWQTTDVDPEFRKGPTTNLGEQLHLREPEQKLLESTEQLFFDESMEVLAEAVAERLPAGTSSGTVMPGLTNLGPGAVRHHHTHHISPSPTGSAASMGSMSATMASLPSTSTIGTMGSLTSMDTMVVTAPNAVPQPSPSAPDQASAPDAAPASSSSRNGAGTGAAASSATTLAVAQAPAAATTTAVTSAEAASVAPAAPAPRQPSEDTVLIVRMAQKVAGWLTGLGTAAFLMAYQWLVEPAPPGSLPVRTFASLAAGPLRPLLLAFYANASDFTRRLTSVRANGKFSHPDAGPEDEWLVQEERLSSVVASLKETYGLDYIYCWHGLPAYWAGVMPDSSELAIFQSKIVHAEPTPGVLEVEPSMAWNPAVLAGVGVIQDPQQLYEAMHSYLRKSGVDGVKVDCQAGVGLVGSAMGGGAALSRKFHSALEDSVLRNFDDNHCINCMCHSTENLYRMTNTSVARASDDFYPRDAASSHPHIAACAFNGLFMSALVQPDWDMFHSRHASAELHGMARAVSGGAVYVSDKPGEHDFELLRRLVLPDGSVLRALQPARPTRDSLFNDVLRDGVSVLKVWTVNAYTGVVGLFNLQGSSWDRTRRKFVEHDQQPKALPVKVYARDVEMLMQDDKPQQQYVLYSFTQQALHVLSRDHALDVTMGGARGDVVTVSPLLDVGGVRFAPIGLRDMFNGGGAVQSCTTHATARHGGAGASFTVVVRGCGRFLAYSNRAPSAVTADRLTLYHNYDASTSALMFEVPSTQDLTYQLTITFRA